MKTQATETETVNNINPPTRSETAKFTLNASAQAFKVLSSSLYENKPLAVLREMVANGLDAALANEVLNSKRSNKSKADAEDSNTPLLPALVQVTLPTRELPHLIVKDLGQGMTKDFLINLYTSYFSTTKGGDNSDIGGFGIGSKSPFAICDQFTITSTTNSETTTAIAYKSNTGPELTIAHHEGTTSPIHPSQAITGTTVTIPVDTSEYSEHTWESIASNLFRYLDPIVEPDKNNPTIQLTNPRPLLTINNNTPSYAPLPRVNLAHEPLQSLTGKPIQPLTRAIYNVQTKSYPHSPVKVVLGGLEYKVPQELIDTVISEVREIFIGEPAPTSAVPDVSPEMRQFRASRLKASAPTITFNIGELELAPSRERLEITEGNQEVLVKAYVDYFTTIDQCITEGIIPALINYLEEVKLDLTAKGVEGVYARYPKIPMDIDVMHYLVGDSGKLRQLEEENETGYKLPSQNLRTINSIFPPEMADDDDLPYYKKAMFTDRTELMVNFPHLDELVKENLAKDAQNKADKEVETWCTRSQSSYISSFNTDLLQRGYDNRPNDIKFLPIKLGYIKTLKLSGYNKISLKLEDHSNWEVPDSFKIYIMPDKKPKKLYDQWVRGFKAYKQTRYDYSAVFMSDIKQVEGALLMSDTPYEIVQPNTFLEAGYIESSNTPRKKPTPQPLGKVYELSPNIGTVSGIEVYKADLEGYSIVEVGSDKPVKSGQTLMYTGELHYSSFDAHIRLAKLLGKGVKIFIPYNKAKAGMVARSRNLDVSRCIYMSRVVENLANTCSRKEVDFFRLGYMMSKLVGISKLDYARLKLPANLREVTLLPNDIKHAFIKELKYLDNKVSRHFLPEDLADLADSVNHQYAPMLDTPVVTGSSDRDKKYAKDVEDYLIKNKVIKHLKDGLKKTKVRSDAAIVQHEKEKAQALAKILGE